LAAFFDTYSKITEDFIKFMVRQFRVSGYFVATVQYKLESKYPTPKIRFLKRL
jgi:hypothetical protein